MHLLRMNAGMVIFLIIFSLSLIRVIMTIRKYLMMRARCSQEINAKVNREKEKRRRKYRRFSLLSLSLWYMGFKKNADDIVYSPVWEVDYGNATYYLESESYSRFKRYLPGRSQAIHINPENIGDYYDGVDTFLFIGKVIKQLLHSVLWLLCFFTAIAWQYLPLLAEDLSKFILIQ